MLIKALLAASVMIVARAASPQVSLAAPGETQQTLSVDEISKFAMATVQLHGSAARELTDQVAIIQEAGLTIERYNQIAGRMSSDPAFAARVNDALHQAVRVSDAVGNEAGRAALPASGDGAVVLEALERVCVPMVRENRAVQTVATLAGFKESRKQAAFTRPLGQDPYRLIIFPRGANKEVCQIEIRHPVGEAKQILKALNIWAAVHQPELIMRRNDVVTGADGLRRRTLSWEHVDPGSSIGLVLVQENNPDGSPLNADYDTARLLYSERRGSASADS